MRLGFKSETINRGFISKVKALWGVGFIIQFYISQDHNLNRLLKCLHAGEIDNMHIKYNQMSGKFMQCIHDYSRQL